MKIGIVLTFLTLLMAAVFMAGCGSSPKELNERGVADFDKKDYASSKLKFAEVLDKFPADPDALFYMGRLVHRERKYNEAIYCYESCLDADPSYVRATYWLRIAQGDVAAVEREASAPVKKLRRVKAVWVNLD